MGSERIQKEMESFQTAIQRLTAEIGNASCLWKDEKYAELSASMGKVASESRAVLLSADRCCSSMEKFNKIAEEKY